MFIAENFHNYFTKGFLFILCKYPAMILIKKKIPTYIAAFSPMIKQIKHIAVDIKARTVSKLLDHH